jgi:hypothetical protein
MSADPFARSASRPSLAGALPPKTAKGEGWGEGLVKGLHSKNVT